MSEWKTMGWSPNIAPGERYGGAKPSRVVATMKRDLVDARRIHYWEGAASLSQMAVDGIGKPDQSRVTVTVPSMTVLGVIEVIPCSDKACASIDAVEDWRV